MTKTSAQVEAEFRADLQALLDKYGAELEAKDHYEGWSECGEDVRMTVCISSRFNAKDGSTISEYAEINLGSFLMGKKNP